jgi:uncharacterized protein YxeA
VKKAHIQLTAILIVFSFSVIITADFWKNLNLNAVTIIEIEAKKGVEESSDSSSKSDQKEDLKNTYYRQTGSFFNVIEIALIRLDQHTAALPSPCLSLPELPPEVA